MRHAMTLVALLALVAGCRSKQPKDESENGLKFEVTAYESVSLAPGPCPDASGADRRWCRDPRHDKARDRFERGDYRATVSLATRALEEREATRRKARCDASRLRADDPLRAEEVRILSLRACARAALGEHDRSLDDYSLALELDPESVDALFGRGCERLAIGDSSGASADFTTVLRFSPGMAAAFANRGNAHAIAGDYERALVDYRAALELAPSLVPVLRNRARVRIQLRDHDGAVDDLEQAVRIDPADRRSRGQLERLRGGA